MHSVSCGRPWVRVPVCVIIVTGPVFHKPTAKHKHLEPWHWGNQFVAFTLLVIWGLIFLRSCS